MKKAALERVTKIIVRNTQARGLSLLLGILLAVQQVATAEITILNDEENGASEIPSLCTPFDIPPFTPLPTTAPQDGRIHLQSDEADMSGEDVTIFTGSVVIQGEKEQVEADWAKYSRNSEILDAEGNVRYRTHDLTILGSKAQMKLNKDEGTFYDATYFMSGTSRARGEAARIHLDQDKAHLYDATYTTCDSNDTDWLLHSSHIELDDTTKQGSASHVVIEFQGIPFLYLPYIQFPIGSERQSGFLFPGFGISDKHGTEISVPYYWNIAPHRDATITPHNMTDRGLMLETEFRYLNPGSEGQFEYDYLPEDAQFDFLSRTRVRWQHTDQLAEGWSSAIEYNRVGDTQHLQDFGGSLDTTSTTHLPQRAGVSYNAPLWSFNGRVEDYQTLSGTKPYQRLPQLSLGTRLPELDNELNYNVQSEWVQFKHETQTPEGERFFFKPEFSLPLKNTWGFLTPKIALHYTQYQLDKVASGEEEAPSRTVPIFSLDSGIFFERDTTFGDIPLLHTLEPRLLYSYVPERYQDDIPIFDSGTTSSGFTQLFNENRFNGIDRVGDSNQITAGITTRFISLDSGAELLSANIGQTFYFDDRKITLPGGQVETQRRSNINAGLSFRPTNRWDFNADMEWNPYTELTEKRNARLQYRPAPNSIFNLAYREVRDSSEVRESSFIWQLNPRWQVFARQLYDQILERNQEHFYGVKYDSCCWSLRLMLHKEYTNSSPDIPDENAIYLEFQLKGLSSFGHRSNFKTLMEGGIPGYTESD